MNRAVEQALTSLIPSLSALPLELVDLAVSLLAQSRSKASTLKPEEEIARSYACAHLACERSKQTLNLPPITPRPPCPPRIYKKLYGFLDTALAPRTPRAFTRTAQPSDRKDPGAASSTPSRSRASVAGTERPNSTPAKRARAAEGENATPTPKRTPKPAAGKGKSNGEDVIAKRIPMIRALCIALNHREAISHVAAGVRSILSAQNEPTQSTPSRSGARTRRSDVVETTISPIPDEEIPALIIVVMVMVGLARSVDAKQMGKSEIEDECDKAMGMLHGENDVVEKFGLDTEVLNEHVESLAERAKKQWMDMEWFNNVEASTEVDDKDGEEDVDMLDVAEHEEDDLIPAPPSRTTPKASKKRKRGDDAAEPFLQPGLGTMFCDAVDWLSEDRRAKYQVWKRDILAQIEGAA